MNPFIDSTIARPLPKDHHDQRWRSPAMGAPMPRQSADITPPDSPDTAHRQLSDAIHPQSPGANPQASGCDGTEPAACGALQQHRDAPRCLRRHGKSLWAAFGLGVSLTLSAVFGPLSNPVVVVSMAAATGLLTPHYAQAMDLNKATAQDLQTLNGIGPKTAAMIVDERTRGGDFASLSDLSDRVRGIGTKKAAALQAAGLKVASSAASGTNANATAASSAKKANPAKR